MKNQKDRKAETRVIVDIDSHELKEYFKVAANALVYTPGFPKGVKPSLRLLFLNSAISVAENVLGYTFDEYLTKRDNNGKRKKNPKA